MGCKSTRAVEVVDAIAAMPLATVEVFDAADDSEAGRSAVDAWRAGAVDTLLKLDVPTKVLMQAVLDSAWGWLVHTRCAHTR